MSKRSIQGQERAIKKFTKELAKLERKYRVYVDGFLLTGNFRKIIQTDNEWETDKDKT